MKISGHKEQAVKFLFMIFAAVLLLISGLTSFSFFYTHFSSLIPNGLIESDISRIISGTIGMTLFDIASFIWLLTFLYHSETSEQRAISLIMTVIAFIGGASASIAYLGLNATGDMQLAETTRQTIGISSLIIVILGIVLNFASSLAHNRYSLESKERVRESNRRDAISQAEQEQAEYLDELITKEVKSLLNEVAPQLALEQAEKLAKRFYGVEVSKYDETDRLKNEGTNTQDIINQVIEKRRTESEYIDARTGEPVEVPEIPQNGEVQDSVNFQNG